MTDREKINEILDRYVDMEVTAPSERYPGHIFRSLFLTVHDELYGTHSSDSKEQGQFAFVLDPDKMQAIRAAAKEKLHKMSLVNAFAAAEYDVAMLKDMKDSLPVDDFSSLFGAVIQSTEVDLNPEALSKEELLSWIKCCNPQAVMNARELEYVRQLPSVVNVYRGSYNLHVEPADCFIWTVNPAVPAQYPDSLFGGTEGYEATVSKEDIFFSFYEEDGRIIVNPDKIHNINQVQDFEAYADEAGE